MLRVIMIVISLFAFTFANEAEDINKYVKELSKLNAKQLTVLIKAYDVGKGDNLGYSLAAVAWKESNFGKYLINLSDGEYGSFGIFHIRLDLAVKRHKITSNWERSRLAERLMHDFDFQAQEALTELIFWQRINKKKARPFKHMFMGYNGGHRGHKIASSRKYADDALLRIKAIKIFFDKHGVDRKLQK